jgi:ribosomal protein L29
MAKNIYKNMDLKELTSNLENLKAELMQLSFDLADKKLKNTSKIGKTKRAIAKVLTEIRNKK